MISVSRRLRTELIGLVLDELTGWQVDQDLFDDAAAEYAGLNRTDTRCLDLLGRHGPMTAGHLATEARPRAVRSPRWWTASSGWVSSGGRATRWTDAGSWSR
jgi:hypothetical protein